MRNRDTDMSRQRTQISALFRFHQVIGITDGYLSVVFFPFGLVSTAAFVAHGSDTFVIVPGDDGYASAADHVRHFIGPDVVTDEVAKTIYGVHFSTVDAVKAGLKRGQVGVDVAEERNLHMSEFRFDVPQQQPPPGLHPGFSAYTVILSIP